MAFLKLTPVLATVLALTTAQETSHTWNSDLSGANLVMQGDNQKLNWGNVIPTDIMEQLRDKCSGIGCSAEPIQVDTQVIVDGKSYMKSLKVTVVDSTFSTVEPGTAGQVIDAIKVLASNAPYVEKSTQHWDQDTEQSSCTSVQANTCWIPNKAEGDTDQYSTARDMLVRVQQPDGQHALISTLHITSEVVDQDGSAWDCAKIVDTAGDVAGMVDGIPGTPFTVFSLICDKLFGLS